MHAEIVIAALAAGKHVLVEKPLANTLAAAEAMTAAAQAARARSKDTKLRPTGRNTVMGSHLPWGEPRRGWDFVSAGRGVSI